MACRPRRGFCNRRLHRYRISRLFEALESRYLLACQVFVRDGTLVVIGDENANQIELVGTEQGVHVTCDGRDHGVFRSLNSIEVQAGDGDDTATIDNRNGSLRGVATHIFGQGGDDRLELGAWTKLDGLDVEWDLAEYDGGEGIDTVVVVGTEVADNIEISRAADSGKVKVADSASGKTRAQISTMDVESLSAQGGAGMDMLNIIASPFADLTLDGGEDADTVAAQFGRLLGQVLVSDSGQQGGDTLKLLGTDFAEKITLFAESQGGSELIAKWEGPNLDADGNEVAIETIEIVHEGFEKTDLDAGGGSDATIFEGTLFIAKQQPLRDRKPYGVRLGEGNDTLTIAGTPLADGFEITPLEQPGTALIKITDVAQNVPLAEISTAGVESLTVKSNAGMDKLTVVGSPFAELALDGGEGDDTIALFNHSTPNLPLIGPTDPYSIVGGEGVDELEVVGGLGGEIYDIRPGIQTVFNIKMLPSPTQTATLCVEAEGVESTKVKTGDGNDEVNVTLPLPTDFFLFTEDGDDDVQLKYTMFLPDGTPVRDTMNVEWKEAADLGSGKDRVRVVGLDSPELFEVRGVPQVTLPDPEIRITDVASGLVPFHGFIVGAEAIDIDTAGGKDRVMMSDAQGSLGGIDWTINTGDDDDTIHVEINTGLQPPSDNPGGDGTNIGTSDRKDPLTTFLFGLKLGAGNDTAFFKSVGGLKYESEVVDYQAGGGNDKIDIQIKSPRDPASFTHTVAPGGGDDEVLVAFEHGDIHVPYVLGALWNDRASPNRRGDQTGGQLSLKTHNDDRQLFVDLGLVGTPGTDHVDIQIAGACHEQTLDINTGEANDSVAVRVVNPEPAQGGQDPEAPAAARRRAPTSINSGDGNDKIKFEETGVVLADGGQADWSFFGGMGKDEFDLRLANAQAGAQAMWNWITDTGEGDDLLKVHLFEIDLGAGSTTDWSFLTGEGRDNIDFVRCFMDVGAAATYAWRLDSGRDDDTLATMIQDVGFGDGAKATYVWNTGAGKDDVTADVSDITLSKGAELDWLLATGDGHDVVNAIVRDRFDGDLRADLGEGNDRFTLDAPNGWQAAAIPNTPCGIVEAGGGNDSVAFRFGGPVLANLELLADLGDGNDDFLLDAQGGWGAPDSQNSPFAPTIQVKGGAHNDTITLHLGQVSGNLDVDVDGMEGNDHLAVDLLFADQGLGLVEIALNGEDGNDLLTLLAFGQSDSQRGNFSIDGGNGMDTCIATPNVTRLNCERHRQPSPK